MEDILMKFKSFADFYPYYLREHKNLMCRRLHFIGTSFVLAAAAGFFVTGELPLLIVLPVAGYGFAWYGHFVYEKNKPASFKFPLYSLMGDFKMFWDILSGKLKAF
jgi:hypothetical protein